MTIKVSNAHSAGSSAGAVAFDLDESRFTAADYQAIGQRLVALAAQGGNFDAVSFLTRLLLAQPSAGVAAPRVPTVGGGYLR
jgi:hypothetical protein